MTSCFFFPFVFLPFLFFLPLFFSFFEWINEFINIRSAIIDVYKIMNAQSSWKYEFILVLLDQSIMLWGRNLVHLQINTNFEKPGYRSITITHVLLFFCCFYFPFFFIRPSEMSKTVDKVLISLKQKENWKKVNKVFKSYFSYQSLKNIQMSSHLATLIQMTIIILLKCYDTGILKTKEEMNKSCVIIISFHSVWSALC